MNILRSFCAMIVTVLLLTSLAGCEHKLAAREYKVQTSLLHHSSTDLRSTAVRFHLADDDRKYDRVVVVSGNQTDPTASQSIVLPWIGGKMESLWEVDPGKESIVRVKLSCGDRVLRIWDLITDASEPYYADYKDVSLTTSEPYWIEATLKGAPAVTKTSVSITAWLKDDPKGTKFHVNFMKDETIRFPLNATWNGKDVIVQVDGYQKPVSVNLKLLGPTFFGYQKEEANRALIVDGSTSNSQTEFTLKPGGNR